VTIDADPGPVESEPGEPQEPELPEPEDQGPEPQEPEPQELADQEPQEPEPEDQEPEPQEPGDDEPEDPGREKKWKIGLACLIGAFASLAAYDLIFVGVMPGAGTSASATASRVVTRPATASPSAAAPSAAAPSASAADPSAAASHAAAPSPAAPSPAASAPAAPALTHPDAPPAPVVGPAPRSLAVAAIEAFGPDGTSDGDHEDFASRALGDGAMPWSSSWYLSPEFGNLKAGTGLLLDMGKSVQVSSVQLILGGQIGADVQVRVGNTAALSALSTVATATDVGGTVRLPTASRASGKYVLVWFTALPPIGDGQYQISVYDTTVDGTAGT
jgi:hypothetical protein